jgi:rhomboid protease GluP
MFEHGGNLGVVTLAGEEWRLLTSMFLHYGVVHIGMNMVGLIGGGRLVERLYGRLGFAAIYLISGLAGSVATALRPGVVSAGASGAIFGVLGALGAFYLLHRRRMDQSIAKEAGGLLVFVGYNVVFGFTQTGIDMYAHLGGLAAGLVCGLAIEAARTGPRLPRTAAVGAIGLVAVIAAALLAPPPVDRNRGAIDAFLATEREVLGRWNAIVPDARSGKLSDDELAAAIERDILPPWRAAVEAFERSEAGGDHRGRFLEYMRVREDAWKILVEAARTQDEATVQRARARFTEADALARKLGE